MLPPRRTRWVELLQEFDLEIVYRPGKDNTAANVLSRPPMDKSDYFTTDDDRARQPVTLWL